MPDFTATPLALILVTIAAYLLGSVPFGLVMARLFSLGDLRKIGSGNIGATNVLRTGHKPAAALTLVLDAGKAGIAVLIARALIGEDAAQIAGFAAYLGHCFPVFLGFKGGKGVATFIGTMLALNWIVGLAVCVAWLLGAAVTRISSMGGLTAAGLGPALMLMLGYSQGMVLATALALLVFIRHKDNIKRIRAGTEPKIGKKT
ncbi:glycerol-3-phosphate 1-O-acyltransferase PlsY [Candidatus Halocynthiibacter alkanivorans]|uniref:glycerol-3-phosphate 1-O-acyltransferase PlsY n=1 Tax=Candidatus Halocynthiibacter alkanivorans TaxID=2267619 RepID=UPI000DF3C7B0|nr:glycerol-3-phosphate 1-O-acyltransferase PlsY [Candidatus Halocynthiibacter alkanivorans]